MNKLNFFFTVPETERQENKAGISLFQRRQWANLLLDGVSVTLWLLNPPKRSLKQEIINYICLTQKPPSRHAVANMPAKCEPMPPGGMEW